jgi:hypothetical protein
MLKIKRVKMLINGRYPDGSKAIFAPDFKYVRYAIILLAALSLSNFEYYTRKIQNSTFISYYDLYRVARFLGLEFERTKSAPYVYKKLIDLKQVRLTVKNNRTLVTLTSIGKKSCEEKLVELQNLNELFNTNPTILENKGGEVWKGTAKGGKLGSLHQLEVYREVNKLIRKISQW